MITEYVVSSIDYIEKNIHSEGVGAIVLIALIIFAVFAFLLLITRKIRLWYWRVNQQMEVLEKIDKNLEALKTAGTRNEHKDIIEETESNCCEMAKETSEKREEENSSSEETLSAEVEKTEFAESKSGNIYTEEQLREIIKF